MFSGTIYKITIDDTDDHLMYVKVNDHSTLPEIVIQVSMLFPTAKKYTLNTVEIEIQWDNTPKDIAEIVEQLKGMK